MNKINPQFLCSLLPHVRANALPRIVPFTIYMVALVLTDLAAWLTNGSWDLRWLYGVKISMVAVALFFFRNDYQELKFKSGQTITFRELVVAVLLGGLVFLLWINLDARWMMLGTTASYFPTTAGSAQGSLVSPQILILVLLRLAGAVLVVPLMEELFWRSFMLRWLSAKDFAGLDPARCSWLSFSIVVLLFGVEHNLWLAGMVAAVVYNYLYISSKKLWLPVISHAVTNGLLGLWVIWSEHWEFW